MGGAIARGLCVSGFVQPSSITVSDLQAPLLEGLKSFCPELNVTTDNFECINGADVIMLAVKPWLMESVIGTLKHSMDYDQQLVVSVAATVTFEKLHALLDDDYRCPPIFRVVPNTAIAVQQSMTFIAAENASDAQTKTVVNIFDSLGKAMLIPESLIEGATALASCGTAFAMRYVRASSEGGVELGFYPEVAKEIVMQTVKGAVELLEANGTHPEIEIDRVTTPGGITIRGLNEMEHAGFTSAVIRGLKAAK